MNRQMLINNRVDLTKSLSSPMIFGFKWTAATTIGYLLGVIITIFAGILLAGVVRIELTVKILNFTFGINYLLMSGIAIGILQGHVLRKSISMRWWVLASLVGWMLAIFLTKAATLILNVPGILPPVGRLQEVSDINITLLYLMEAALIGIFVGLYQSLLIRKIFSRAYCWIIINLVSWGTASVFIALNHLRGEIYISIISLVFYVLVYSWLPGFIAGVLTAIGATWIMIGPQKADQQRTA